MSSIIVVGNNQSFSRSDNCDSQMFSFLEDTVKTPEIVEIMKQLGCALIATGTQDGMTIYHFLAPNGDAIFEIAEPVMMSAELSAQTELFN